MVVGVYWDILKTRTLLLLQFYQKLKVRRMGNLKLGETLWTECRIR